MAIKPERSQMIWEAPEHHQNLSLVGSGANGSHEPLWTQKLGSMWQ